MKNNHNQGARKLVSRIPVDKQTTEVTIRLKYIDVKKVKDLTPKERLKAIDKYFQDRFSKLLKMKLFDVYEVVGNKKRPAVVKTTMLVTDIDRLNSHSFVESIYYGSVKGARKVPEADVPMGYYCIKMTVAIQIEGEIKGLQSYEERFVIIRARSHDDAYERLEKQEDKYVKPYLNSDGRFVRWKIESYDDCYITDITDASDIDNPEGAEVFSVLKNRRLTNERAWDGKW